MFKITVKSFFAKKLRFILTGLSVVLGVAFMTGTMVFTATIQNTFDDLFAQIGEGTDAIVRSSESIDTFGDEVRPLLPASLLGEVRKVDGVQYAEGDVQFGAQIIGTDNEAVGNPGMGAPTFGIAWSDNHELNPFRIDEGRSPRADNEVVVDRGSAKKGHIDVGDTIKIKVNPEITKYKVVGIAKFGTTDSPLGASASMFTRAAAQKAAGFGDEYTSVSVVAEPGVSQEQLVSNVSLALRSNGDIEAITGKQAIKENQDDIADALGFFSTGLMIFAIVAVVVGAFIIYNTFNILVAQRSRELALLRAVGASRRQVMSSVLGESLLVALVASALGVVAGIFISGLLKQLLVVFGIDIPASGLVITAKTVAIGLEVGIVVTLFSAVFPAWRAARIPPVAAMRDVAIERQPHPLRRGLLGAAILLFGVALIMFVLFADADVVLVGFGALAVFIGAFVLGPLFSRPVARVLGWPIARLRGTTGKLSQENAARNPYRTAATAAALMIGVSLVGFITIFAASAKASIFQAVDDQFKADYIVSSGANLGFAPSLANQLKEVPELEAVDPVRFDGFEVGGKGDYVTGLDPAVTDAVLDPKVLAGSLADLGPGEVAISKAKADDEGWKLGDALSTEFRNGPALLTVAAIYDETLFLGNYTISLATWDQNYPAALDQLIAAKLKPGVSPEQGRAAMQKVLDADPTAELQDQAQFKADQAALINGVVNLVYALLGLAVFIALIGIANTLALSIFERTRELGLLRAVGMSRSQVRSSVRWESVIISLFGTFLGLIIGLFFGFVIVLALRDEGFSEFAAAPGQLAIVVVVAAICGVLAAIGPARRAAKLDVLQAIAQ